MSKTIQEAMDLPVLEDLLKNGSSQEGEAEPEITDEMAEEYDDSQALDGLTTALAAGGVTQEVVTARQEADHALGSETVYKEALQHSRDLMDLGYNVDTRSAGRIFEIAAGMLKVALDAKNSKRDAQLKAAKVLIDKRKQDLAEKMANPGEGSSMEVEGVVVEDRNDLIRRLREAAKNNK